MRHLLQIIRVLGLVVTLVAVAAAVVWNRYPDVLASVDDRGIARYGSDSSNRVDSARALAETDPGEAMGRLAIVVDELSSYQKHNRLFGLRRHAVLVFAEVAVKAGKPERAARAMLRLLEDYPKDVGLSIRANGFLISSDDETVVAEGRQNLKNLFNWLPTVSSVAKAHITELKKQGLQAEIVDAVRTHLAQVDGPMQLTQNLRLPWRISWSASGGKAESPRKLILPEIAADTLSIHFQVPEGKSVLNVRMPGYCIAQLSELQLRVNDGTKHFTLPFSELVVEPDTVFTEGTSSLSSRGSHPVQFSASLPPDLAAPIRNGIIVARVERLPRWLSELVAGPEGREIQRTAKAEGDERMLDLVRREWLLDRAEQSAKVTGPADGVSIPLTPVGQNLVFTGEWSSTTPSDQIRITLPAQAGDVILINQCTITTSTGDVDGAPFADGGPVQWHGVTFDGEVAIAEGALPYLEWRPADAGSTASRLILRGMIQ